MNTTSPPTPTKKNVRHCLGESVAAFCTPGPIVLSVFRADERAGVGLVSAAKFAAPSARGAVVERNVRSLAVWGLISSANAWGPSAALIATSCFGVGNACGLTFRQRPGDGRMGLQCRQQRRVSGRDHLQLAIVAGLADAAVATRPIVVCPPAPGWRVSP